MLLYLCPVAFAETPDSPTQNVLVRAARVLDVKTGRYLDKQGILIEGERITEHASNAKVVDLGRATVLPGLIDCHTHVTFDTYHLGYNKLAVSLPRHSS
jgi:imidazolonepropionase-like amidohydrolase